MTPNVNLRKVEPKREKRRFIIAMAFLLMLST